MACLCWVTRFCQELSLLVLDMMALDIALRRVSHASNPNELNFSCTLWSFLGPCLRLSPVVHVWGSSVVSLKMLRSSFDVIGQKFVGSEKAKDQNLTNTDHCKVQFIWQSSWTPLMDGRCTFKFRYWKWTF